MVRASGKKPAVSLVKNGCFLNESKYVLEMTVRRGLKKAQKFFPGPAIIFVFFRAIVPDC